MKRIWWAQIKAVIRLEMKKTFFAKRGLWIYVLAALAGSAFHRIRHRDFQPAGQKREHRAAEREAAGLSGFAGG